MSFIEWMTFIYLISITGVDVVQKNISALYLRAGISLFALVVYSVYLIFKAYA